MARRVFFSFHFDKDCWRTSQIRNIGSIDGNRPVTDNRWEEIKEQGEQAIKDWIDNEMKGTSCTIVLIGSQTAGRKWINYEIKKTWDDGKGLLGIYIHGLKNQLGMTSSKGRNPFNNFNFGNVKLSNIVKTYNPPNITSNYVYRNIKDNISSWVEEAITIRENY